MGGKAVGLRGSRHSHGARLVPIACKGPSSAALCLGQVVEPEFSALYRLRLPLEAKGMVILIEFLKGGSEWHVRR
jgi:hypothetical protein